MRHLKSVENFSDVTCENCVSYSQCRCCKDLPAIPVEPNNKCGDGYWLLKEDTANFHNCCFELLPFGFVTDVEDLLCKNCGYYDSSREECHYQRLNIYKSAPSDWCSNGAWLYRDNDSEVSLGSVYFLYQELIEGKDNETISSKAMRQVKSVEIFSDVTCQNCISYNQGRCCYTLPSVPVGPDDKCNEGQWLHKGRVLNLHGVSHSLLPDSFVTDIQDLTCGECIFYNSSKQECHFHRQSVYKSGPNDWCDNGDWLYEDKSMGVITDSLYFLYPKLIESKDTEN